ncbi:MAG: magnesium-translocating P-type ATPase [Steroidobacteraceae bacterium]
MTTRRTAVWLPWLLGAAALAAVVMVVARASQERAFVTLLEHAQPQWLLWAVLLQAATYASQAAVWRTVLGRTGSRLEFGTAYRLSLAKLFVDQALPSLGVSGNVVVAQALEARGHARSAVMSAVAVDIASYWVAYVLCLAAALALLVAQGHATSLIVTVAVLFFAFGTGLGVAVLSLSGRSPGRWLQHVLKVPAVGRALSLLQQADPRMARSPVLLALTTALQASIAVLDAVTVWVLLRALGTSVDPSAVFASFMVASLLRTFGFLPGGMGTFEAACVGTLVLVGVPIHAGLSATLLFRGLSFWLPMIPGLAVSRRIAAARERPVATETPFQYWALAPEDAAARLQTATSGLTADEAARRLASYGRNEVREREGYSRLGVLWNQVRSPLLMLLLFAAGVSMVTGEWVDATIVLAIVVATVGIGYTREYRAQRAAEELRARIQVRATLLRDGRPASVPIEEVVPGDVALLSAGSIVPADAVLLEAADCYVNESVLTGESFPVRKRPAVAARDAPLSRRINCVYLGTSVRSGTARCLVVRTGHATEFGAIAHRLALRPPETEFDRGIRHFGYMLTTAMTVMVLLVLAANLLLERPLIETLLFSIALAVGLSPELLPAILSVNLARGASAMAAHGVLVRRLNAIENLGSMDVLCTDKTGTLTEGVVRMHGAWGCDGTPSTRVMELGALNAALQSGLANPLDEAILLEHRPATDGVEKVGEIPYDFVRKRLSVAIRDAHGRRLVTKGAVGPVLSVCSRVAGRDSPGEPARAALLEQARAWTERGIRVLAVATRDLVDTASIDRETEHDLVFEGFLTFLDNPKEGVSQAIADLGRLGVSIKLISGDAGPVARYVAASVGMPGERMLTGQQLDELHDEALWHEAERTDLFVEVDPNQKERIILALKKTGHVVGFIGDGINDAPAMHAADTSLSVEGAVDVARAAADFVLLERDLDVIRRGIEEGRRTFANTLKYVLTTTSANLGNMISMAVVSLVLPFLPLLAGQILLNNFLSDVPAVGIADDDVDQELVEKPRRWSMRFLGRFMVEFGVLSSLFDFLTFALLLWGFAAGPELFRTGWFVESLLTELVVALVVRTRRPAWRSRPGSLLLWTSVAVTVLAYAIPYVPGAHLIGFTPLPAGVLLAVTGIVVLYVASTELLKKSFYRRSPA